MYIFAGVLDDDALPTATQDIADLPQDEIIKRRHAKAAAMQDISRRYSSQLLSRNAAGFFCFHAKSRAAVPTHVRLWFTAAHGIRRSCLAEMQQASSVSTPNRVRPY